MSKQDEAGLILKLYELRREDEMRKAREWFLREFNPQSLADFNSAIFGAHSGHLRMVVSFWEMAAALVNDGAIRLELFQATNSEHIAVFAKIEPILEEIRIAYGPRYAASLEKLIDAIPDGRKQVAANRERLRKTFAERAAKQTAVQK
jgi:hypothetical protein